MPLIVFGMSIAKPPAAFRAVYGRRIIARLVVRRHCLTQAVRMLSRHADHTLFIKVKKGNGRITLDVLSGSAAGIAITGFRLGT
jgi:hypothetical protein